jgi:hypothetical protein
MTDKQTSIVVADFQNVPNIPLAIFTFPCTLKVGCHITWVGITLVIDKEFCHVHQILSPVNVYVALVV